MTVDGDIIVLAGADVVDGTPVLDVKPYLPFADGVPGAFAPPWVRILSTKEIWPKSSKLTQRLSATLIVG